MSIDEAHPSACPECEMMGDCEIVAQLCTQLSERDSGADIHSLGVGADCAIRVTLDAVAHIVAFALSAQVVAAHGHEVHAHCEAQPMTLECCATPAVLQSGAQPVHAGAGGAIVIRGAGGRRSALSVFA